MDMEKSEKKPTERLVSLDALRGFDMFFITGGHGLILSLCAALGCSDCVLARQMHHVPWDGLAHCDTIFPLFLFLAGVSWPFARAAQEARGRSLLQIHGKVVLRMLTLFAFGLLYEGLLACKPTFRIPSVLGFIGLSWGVAALVSLHVRRAAHRLSIALALLFGYWALLAFVGAPDAPAGADLYAREWNVVSWLDRVVMPNHIYKTGVYDPESLFALAGGVVTALLGMHAGEIVKNTAHKPAWRALELLLFAGVILALDLVFILGLGCPSVKALWSPSFVLSAGAYSAAMFALFYWIIDVCGFTRWTLYFRVIGMNAITIYLAQRILGFTKARDFFFGGFAAQLPPVWRDAFLAAGYLAVVWAFLYFLYRRKIFLKT